MIPSKAALGVPLMKWFPSMETGWQPEFPAGITPADAAPDPARGLLLAH
jgi:hypothetical protein